LIKATEPIVPSAIEIIEKCSGFCACLTSFVEELIESIAMFVVLTLVVCHHERSPETALEPTIEVNHMGIYIVEKSAPGHEPKRDRQASAKRFDQATVAVRCPKQPYMRNLPTFATRPL
jgi:hypothetical protein